MLLHPPCQTAASIAEFLHALSADEAEHPVTITQMGNATHAPILLAILGNDGWQCCHGREAAQEAAQEDKGEERRGLVFPILEWLE